MKFVANFEVSSECSVVADGLVLRFNHARENYRVRVKNITRDVYSTPFLLSFHIYFEAPELSSAQELAEAHLADCLNMLSFATSGAYRLHRIRNIVDAGASAAMRDVLMWGDSIAYENPMPFLGERMPATIERLSDWDIPGPIRRSMRWYRLGVNAHIPDDQFMNFWFALEIVAEFQKSTDKVASKCAKCGTPLYCETCKAHPLHRPYAKQAIRALLELVDPNFHSDTWDRLDRTRNGLMHGETLKEIEGDAPESQVHIVDILGRLLWKALAQQFPPDIFSGGLSLGAPSTYIHKKLSAVAHIQTVVPADPDGDLNLDFTGTELSIVTEPPQSALPTVIGMTREQHEKLASLRCKEPSDREMCERILSRHRSYGDRVEVLVLSTDMARISRALAAAEAGEWQDIFREILRK